MYLAFLLWISDQKKKKKRKLISNYTFCDLIIRRHFHHLHAGIRDKETLASAAQAKLL